MTNFITDLINKFTKRQKQTEATSSHGAQHTEAANPLGIDTTSIGSLKAKDLINNKPLASTVLNYLRNCEGKVASLETENETLKTYANNFGTNQLKSKIAIFLAFLSTVSIGFGTNFLTNNPTGGALLITAGWVFVGFGTVLFLAQFILLWGSSQ